MPIDDQFADMIVRATMRACEPDGWQSELERLKDAAARRPATAATVLINGISCDCEQCRMPAFPGHNSILDYAVVSGLEEAKTQRALGWLVANRAMRRVPDFLAEEVAAESLREYRAIILAEKDVNLFCRKIEVLIEDCSEEGIPGLIASERLKLRAATPGRFQLSERLRTRRRRIHSANLFKDFGIEVPVVERGERELDVGEHCTFVRRLGWVPLKI